MRLRLILGFLCFLFAPSLFAQSWSGILAPSRAENWQRANVGVPGGIPTGWTQCGSTILAYGSMGSPGSVTTINNALASCGTNQCVMLGSGVFWLDARILLAHSNLCLSGQSAILTILEFPNGGQNTCVQGDDDICMGGNQNSPFLNPGGGQTLPGGNYAFSWTGGFSQGATSITISGVGTGGGGIANGDMVMLYQKNDLTDNGGQISCDTGPGATPLQCSQQGGSYGPTIGGVEYSQAQNVRVTAGCPCSGPGSFTVTISPGLYANNWNATGQVYGLFVKPVTMVGVQNLTVDDTNNVPCTIQPPATSPVSSPCSNFGVANVDGWWIRNVTSIKSQRNHVWTSVTSHGEIRDCYMWGTKGATDLSYAIENSYSSDDLFENCIYQQVASPFIGPAGQSGNVIGYNFWIDPYYCLNPMSGTCGMAGSGQGAFMQTSYIDHDAGGNFNLYEGNQGNGLYCDDVHGTSALQTMFRNWLNGRDYNTAGGLGNQPSGQTYPIDLDAYCRGFNIVGNVLGTPGYHSQYQNSPGMTVVNCNQSIWYLGWSSFPCADFSGSLPSDPVVAATLFRWGNYDTVTGAVQWNSSEASPGAVAHIGAQSVPATHTLPNSFYYSSKPAFFGSGAWPVVGPDITGGSGPGGFAGNNPAANCYYNILGGPTDGSGAVLPFDAGPTGCNYGSGGGGTPGFSSSPASFNFGNVLSGCVDGACSAYQGFTITNTGMAPLVISSVNNTTGNTGDFLYISNGCGGMTILAGSTCSITMQFAPSALGARSTLMTFSDNAGGHTVALSGNGISAIPTLPNPPTGLTLTVQ
jgi:hypothetical protein